MVVGPGAREVVERAAGELPARDGGQRGRVVGVIGGLIGVVGMVGMVGVVGSGLLSRSLCSLPGDNRRRDFLPGRYLVAAATADECEPDENSQTCGQ